MKLVEFDRSNLTDPERYYIEGLTFVPVDSSKILPILKDLWQGKVKDGFSWEQSMNSYTLRPTVYDFDEAFVDFVVDGKLPYLIDEITCRNLTLAHIQVVKTDPGRSYQDWHRDTYQFGDKPVVGAMPAAHKIIFYPEFEGHEPRLKYILGSHRTMVNDPKFDEMLIRKYETNVLGTSNEHALLFDTSLLHGVIPDVNPKGSIRLIYSFVDHHQYDRRFKGKENHDRLKQLFEDKAYPL
jgi:hypothetical protein